MDQLVQFMQQRHRDIRLLQNNGFTNLAEQFNKQKERIHKQNWILKVFKSIKVLTPQLKSDFYYKSQIMMNLQDKINMERSQNLDEHFTEKIINLYIDFFNLIASRLPLNGSIKTLMRPNNSFIITDLIKSLIDLQRRKFREIYANNFNIQNEIKQSQSKLIPSLHNHTEKQCGQLKQQQLAESKKMKKSKLSEPYNPAEMIKQSLKEKYENYIKSIDLKSLQNKFNQQFAQIKSKNNKNAHLINKFRVKCLGPLVKNTQNYDLGGLYTRQQLMEMQKSLIDKQNLQKAQEEQLLKQPNELNPLINEKQQNPSQEIIQLKQKALKQLQNKQNYYTYHKSSSHKYLTIHKWFPVAVFPHLSKERPWEICIINRKHKVKISEIIEDPEISSVGVKQFLLQKLNQRFQFFIGDKSQNDDSLVFDKHLFLDFHRKKEFQMVDNHRNLLKKQLFFPNIKQQYQKDTQMAKHQKSQVPHFVVRKSKSQQKFLPRISKLHQAQSNRSIQSIHPSLQKASIIKQNQNQGRANIRSLQHIELGTKKPTLSFKLRKNSLEDALSEKIQQRRQEIQQENKRYQNRIRLLFGTQDQKSVLKNKNRTNKTSIIGLSNNGDIFRTENFLLL